MNLSIIKNLFKRKKTKIENVDIATIDTSFIDVPKLEEFSKEEQEVILDYFNKLSLNNYEDLIKFSSDLASQYSLEQELFQHTMERYNKEYTGYDRETIKEEKNLYTYINLSIVENYEYHTTIDHINEIRKELYLRLTALDMFIKKEEKKKFNPLTIFHKAEKMAYIEHKSRLINERERIKQLIKQNTIISIALYRKIDEKNKLKEQCDLYKQYQSYLEDEDNYEQKIKDYFAEVIVERIKPLFDYTSLWKPFCQDITKIINETILNITKKRKKADYSTDDTESEMLLKQNVLDMAKEQILESDQARYWRDIINLISNESLKNVYRLLAKYLHECEIYRYNHKDDYKTYLKEMSEIINTYEKMRTDDWDVNYLKKTYRKYKTEAETYKKYYHDYLGTDVITELEKKATRIEWLYALKDKYFYLYRSREDHYPIAKELLTKLEDKYGIKFGNLLSEPSGAPTNKKNYIIDNLHMFTSVYDLLNGYYNDVLDYTLDLEIIHSIQKSITRPPYYPATYHMNPNECFHIKSLHKMNLFDTKRYSSKCFNFKHHSIHDHHFFYDKIIKKLIEDRYTDDRILYIPSKVIYEALNSRFHDLLSGNKTAKDLMNIEAIYIEGGDTLKELIKDFYYCFPQKTTNKYLFTTKSAMGDVLKWENTFSKKLPFFITERDGISVYSSPEVMSSIFKNGRKLIVFPDDYTYEDMSNYLDSLLEKDKVFEKIAN